MNLFDRITAKAMPVAEDEYDEDYGYAEEGGYAEDYYEDEAPVALHPVNQPEVARIVTSWVANYKDIHDFAAQYRDGLPVILNLAKASDGERLRIVDFALGLTFGLDGSFNKISDDVFLLTPHSVKIEEMQADKTFPNA